jgi:uncharacterized RDD family membrane protein YckC
LDDRPGRGPEAAGRTYKGFYAHTGGGWPPPGAEGGSPAGVIYAGWWDRFGAIVLDGLITAIPVIVLTVVAGEVLGAIASLVAWTAYSMLMLRAEAPGQTPGKAATGVRVIRADGEPLTVGTILIRELVCRQIALGLLSLLVLPLLANYLWPLWDSERRTLVDKVAGTRVVRVRR